jgi:membrane-bound serine protease (ClpP class)
LLMLLAVAFFVAEAFVPTHGALAVAGGVLFVLGSLILFDPAGDAYQVSLPVAIGIALALVLLVGIALSRVVRVARAPVAGGTGGLVGTEGVVRRDGLVRVSGELWRARTADGSPLSAGERVRVEQVEDNLRLVVGSTESPTGEESS